MKAFKDHEGNWSSFRLVWVIATLSIALVWAYSSLKQGLQPWPLDGLTTVGLFSGPGLKTYTERLNNKP